MPDDLQQRRYRQLAVAVIVILLVPVVLGVYLLLHNDYVQPIAKYRASPVQKATPPDILSAAASGDIETVKTIVRANPDAVKQRDEKKRTALHLAATYGHTATAQFLVANHAKLSAPDHHETQPLLNAAYNGHGQTVGALLDAGADIESRDDRGGSALYYAASKGHRDVVELLLSKGADINARAYNNVTPLGVAIRNGHDDLAAFLKQHDAKE